MHSEEQRIDKTILEPLWRELLGTQFDIRRLAHGIVDDCGIDASGLTPEDLVRLYERNTHDKWEDVGWAFNEVLAYYSVSDLSDEEFVRALFVSLFLAQAIRLGHGHWSFSFDKMCKLIVRNISRGDFEFRMRFFRALLPDGSG